MQPRMPYFNYFVQINIIKHFYAIGWLSVVLQSPKENQATSYVPIFTSGRRWGVLRKGRWGW